jgi:hypothetical protein
MQSNVQKSKSGKKFTDTYMEIGKRFDQNITGSNTAIVSTALSAEILKSYGQP